MNEQLTLFEDKRIVLLSIREEYFNKMLDGSKKYEFRTRYLNQETIAYIYISKTVKKIVAKIEFSKPIIGSANDIALLSEQENPNSYKRMKDYLHESTGYAIPIKRIIPINEISLQEIKEFIPDFVPPQSYYYLDNKPKLLNFILNKENER